MNDCDWYCGRNDNDPCCENCSRIVFFCHNLTRLISDVKFQLNVFCCRSGQTDGVIKCPTDCTIDNENQKKKKVEME